MCLTQGLGFSPFTCAPLPPSAHHHDVFLSFFYLARAETQAAVKQRAQEEAPVCFCWILAGFRKMGPGRGFFTLISLSMYHRIMFIFMCHFYSFFFCCKRKQCHVFTQTSFTICLFFIQKRRLIISDCPFLYIHVPYCFFFLLLIVTRFSNCSYMIHLVLVVKTTG